MFNHKIIQRLVFGRLMTTIASCLILLYSNQVGAQQLDAEVNLAEQSWSSAWSNGDTSAYRELLADEFTWTYVTGLVIDKEEAINRLNPFTITENSKTIRIYGNTAVVYGTVSLMF